MRVTLRIPASINASSNGCVHICGGGGGGGAPKNSPDMGYTKYICDLKKTQRTSAKGGLRRNIPINGDSQQK